MSDDQFVNCSPGWLRSLSWDIRDRKAAKEDVELTMKYFCHLQQTSQAIPNELLSLIEQIFSGYFKRKHFDGELEAAFGFTGKQGNRKLERRNSDLATDIMRHYIFDYPVYHQE